jgi:hypothetical protein
MLYVREIRSRIVAAKRVFNLAATMRLLISRTATAAFGRDVRRVVAALAERY